MESNPTISILSSGYSFQSLIKNRLRSALKAIGAKRLSGPEMVERNLLSGLNNIKASYLINPPVSNTTSHVGVLRHMGGFRHVHKNIKKIDQLIIGPNFSAEEMLAIYNETTSIKLFLAPSPGVSFTFEYYGIPKEKIALWPVGINTYEFSENSQESKSIDALVYFKGRNPEELAQVKHMLESCKQRYVIIQYGHYTEMEFKNYLQKCRYAMILDHTESQGIALQEIMSSNVPMFVFDQIFQGNSPKQFIRNNFTSTSVPYWDPRCGMKVPTDMYGQSKHQYYKIPETTVFFTQFLGQLPNFKPREYIVQNLSLEKQAREFLNFFR